MSKVRAKMVCTGITPNINDQKTVDFQAVTTGSEENKSFSRWTPCANLSMCISNETTAGDAFEVGKEYFLDFTPAE